MPPVGKKTDNLGAETEQNSQKSAPDQSKNE